jgi:CheY-like chemotaxis protein
VKSLPNLIVHLLQETSVAPTAQVTDKRPLALLVDDQSVNLRILERMLQDQYECVLATSGQQALELFSSRIDNNPFQLCLTDLIMPEMSGYQLVREMRKVEAEHKIERIPIIAVSAGVGESERQEFKESEMDGFCPKPFNKAHIHSLIRAVLENTNKTSKNVE